MMRPAVLSVLLLLLGQSLVLATEIHISPTGDDHNIGDAAHPLATLAAAQAKVRQLAPPKEITQIVLHGGTYYLADTLLIEPADSGTKTAPIIWASAENENAIISGAIRLDHLQWSAYKNGILQATVPDSIASDQLFVNGQRQILARYPNFDPSTNIFNGYAADCIAKQRVAGWTDPAGGFFHAMHPAMWGDFTWQITGKNPDDTLKMEGGWQGNRAAGPHAKYRFVENIFEELDSPGEWFLNSKTHTLYFYPPARVDLKSAVIEMPRLKNLIEFRGNESNPVRFVSCQNITFEHTLRTFMETREPILRTDWTIHRGGAVFFNGCEDCGLVDCFINQPGGNAVFVNNFNRHVHITGCRIDQAGASGVMFLGNPDAVRSPLFEYNKRQSIDQIDQTPGPKSNDYPADCAVSDCLITLPGRFEKQATGVGIDVASRITVQHCSIYDTPRAGINIGDGCWGGHVIEFCDVFDTVKETGDHGSFNSWGRDRYWGLKGINLNQLGDQKNLPLLDVIEPITLRNNRWRCDHGWDIDLDDGSSNYHIFNNLCLHGGIKNREGFDRTVENNICVANSFHPHVWFQGSGDVFRKNIVFQPYKPIGMPAVWGSEIDSNFLHDPSSAAGPAVALQRSSKQDQHSLIGDAGFVDPAHGDFTVKENSPALSLGFKNFPMDQFGVQSPKLKAIARKPSFDLTGVVSKRSSKVETWQEATVRNIVGEGEMSAHGLPGETGVLVLDIPVNSRLARAGIKRDDVIVSVNGKKVDGVRDLPADDINAISVVRDQNTIQLKPPN